VGAGSQQRRISVHEKANPFHDIVVERKKCFPLPLTVVRR
jgi:hypothetical protein